MQDFPSTSKITCCIVKVYQGLAISKDVWQEEKLVITSSYKSPE